MCGIAGYYSPNKQIDRDEMVGMCEQLKHRGPNHTGIEFFKNNHLSLGHTRLSFLDLSEKGHQPMSNANQTCWVTFNGELYNYKELQIELEGTYQFRSNSDTEVILAAYQKWGISCIEKFVGMFAFALYDATQNNIYLVRDRFGIKPLYFFNHANGFGFASELKAFERLSAWRKELDYSSFCDFFVYRYVPSPKTIWKDTHKVAPAHYVTLNLENCQTKTTQYWDVEVNNIKISRTQAIEEVSEQLTKSVKQQLHADVEVGSFLSGGYDSSTLCLLAKQLGHKPKTFSVGFSDWEKSEHRHAKLLADHLNLPNSHYLVNEQHEQDLASVGRVYDEPLADISTLPTFLVSKLASKKVKAVISGEGADELFVGYHWQQSFQPKKGLMGIWQNPQKSICTHYAANMSMGAFDRNTLKQLLPTEFHASIPEDPYWFYKKHLRKGFSPIKQLQYLDLKTFLAELVLPKVDRASMANSLEVRVPFLDHRLVEKIFSWHEQVYMEKGVQKVVLRQMLKNNVPKAILTKPKQGFVGPDSFYQNIELSNRYLKQSKLVKDGLVNAHFINEISAQPYDWRRWKLIVMEHWYTLFGQ